MNKPKKVKEDKIKTWRVGIKYTYPSGKTDKLSIKTPILFSWGIQENNFSGDNNKTYSMSLVMYNSTEEPTTVEKKTIKLMVYILQKCKKHLNLDEVKETIEQYNMEQMLNNMDIFYRKKDKGEIIPGRAPVLYPKLRTAFRKTNKKPSCR